MNKSNVPKHSFTESMKLRLILNDLMEPLEYRVERMLGTRPSFLEWATIRAEELCIQYKIITAQIEMPKVTAIPPAYVLWFRRIKNALFERE